MISATAGLPARSPPPPTQHHLVHIPTPIRAAANTTPRRISALQAINHVACCAVLLCWHPDLAEHTAQFVDGCVGAVRLRRRRRRLLGRRPPAIVAAAGQSPEARPGVCWVQQQQRRHQSIIQPTAKPFQNPRGVVLGCLLYTSPSPRDRG